MKALVVTLTLLGAWPALAQTAPRTEYPETQSRSAPIAPAAADQALGMAIMSAVVNSAGNLMRGSGAVSSVRNGVGYYVVTFERSVHDCTISAISANASAGGGTTACLCD